MDWLDEQEQRYSPRNFNPSQNSVPQCGFQRGKALLRCLISRIQLKPIPSEFRYLSTVSIGKYFTFPQKLFQSIRWNFTSFRLFHGGYDRQTCLQAEDPRYTHQMPERCQALAALEIVKFLSLSESFVGHEQFSKGCDPMTLCYIVLTSCVLYCVLREEYCPAISSDT